MDHNSLDSYLWGQLKILVCSAPIENEGRHYECIVYACQTIPNRSVIFEKVRQTMFRRAHACIDNGGENFDH
jgi:hypothetical protein